jgi:molybdopterin/thiamine biosynthesis adenylyltransferase/rhodanese-related sulfurtransferase
MSTDPFHSDSAEISPAEALSLQRAGAVLIDVREDEERASGQAAGSIGIPGGQLAARIGDAVSTVDQPILTLCAGGRRSLLARDVLLQLGYRNVLSVSGGFQRWVREQLPLTDGALDADASERYSRHLVLPEVGVRGQQRLLGSRVAMIGAGGLGSPSALYLAAAGVGQLTLIDDDRVERSNLQRQIIHTDARIGRQKTESARDTLLGLNPKLKVEIKTTRLSAVNVEELLAGHDVVIDGADNFPTRYLVDAACRQLGIPWVYGAVHRFTGQVSVFDPRREGSPCYRCLFPEPPSAADAPNCSEAGVLGVLPGTIGLLQATEVIKLILGIGRPLVGRLLCYDALQSSFRELSLPRDAGCPGCGADVRFMGYSDIAQFCAG